MQNATNRREVQQIRQRYCIICMWYALLERVTERPPLSTFIAVMHALKPKPIVTLSSSGVHR
jgi:hypothetical protein